MGWNESTGQTDHTALMAYVAGLDDAALVHVAEDSLRAADAMPEGKKAGYYQDTVHYCSMERARRKLSVNQ